MFLSHCHFSRGSRQKNACQPKHAAPAGLVLLPVTWLLAKSSELLLGLLHTTRKISPQKNMIQANSNRAYRPVNGSRVPVRPLAPWKPSPCPMFVFLDLPGGPWKSRPLAEFPFGAKIKIKKDWFLRALGRPRFLNCLISRHLTQQSKTGLEAHPRRLRSTPGH